MRALVRPGPEQARAVATLTAAGRTGLGVVALVVPAVPLGPWVGAARHDQAARLLARALGGRDLALGLGALLTLRSGAPARSWVRAGGLADAGDVVATLLSWRHLPRRGRVAVLVAAGAGVGAAVLAEVGGGLEEVRSRRPADGT